jgi:hypothetical protein
MSPGNGQQDYLAEVAPHFDVLGRLGEHRLEPAFKSQGNAGHVTRARWGRWPSISMTARPPRLPLFQ